MPFSHCPCCTGPKPAHAILGMRCGETGDEFQVRVPWSARYDSTGWGDRARVRWRGEDGADFEGVELARGPKGIRAVDATGSMHELDHGRYAVAQPKPAAPKSALRKGFERWLSPLTWLMKARPLKEGERWITVHPNGDEGKGVPVLISPNPDGTHSIIGGAGGKLNHLTLRSVKTPEEHEAEAAERAKKKGEAKKAKKAGQTPEQQAEEKASKEELRKRKRVVQRSLVERVRSTLGGVDEDLPDERLRGLDEGVRNRLESDHHRKQYQQAKRKLDEATRKLVEHEVEDRQAEAVVRGSVEEDPAIADDARRMATTMLEEQEAEEEERKRERAQRATRTTGGKTDVGERAADAVAETIREMDDPEQTLRRMGGRADDEDGRAVRENLLASEEVSRRALEAKADAKVLLDIAEGRRDPKEDEAARKVAEQVLQKAGGSLDDEDVAGTLKREAARKARRAESLEARARSLASMESDGEKGEEAAQRTLAYTDLLANLTSGAAAARKLGLADSERVPVREAEMAELTSLLTDASTMKKQLRELDKLNAEIEKGDYAAARRGFDVKVTSAPADVQQEIEDQVRTELAQQIRGVADRQRPAFMQAHAAGQYDAMADIALGIGGQRYIDRTVLDAVGPRNAAVLMAHQLLADGHDPKDVVEALERQHVASQEKVTADALRKADAFVPELQDQVDTYGSIDEAMKHLEAHEADLDDAQRAVGAALGRMDATAAFAQVLREKMPDTLTVEAGQAGFDSTLAWLHSTGLKPGDYSINHKDKKITIPRSSWDKLADRVPGDEIKMRQAVQDVKAGRRDEVGWLPEGITQRAASTFTAPTPDNPRWFEPLNLASPNIGDDVRMHVGSRLAEGEQPHDIMKDLLAPATVDQVEDKEGYQAAVKAAFPAFDADGNYVKAKDNADHYNGLAEAFMQARHGGATGAFHAQDLSPNDPSTREALFRTLADMPHARAAFTPVADLSFEDRQALRDHLYKKLGVAETGSYDAQYDRAMRELPQEPPQFESNQGGMFGGGMFGGDPGPQVPTREWREWADKVRGLAQRFPKQGRDLAIRALGPRPEEKRPGRLEDGHLSTVDEVFGERPLASSETIAREATRRLGRKAVDEKRAALLSQLGDVDEGRRIRELSKAGLLHEEEYREHARKLRESGEMPEGAGVHDWMAEQGIRPADYARHAPNMSARDVEQWTGGRRHDAEVEHLKNEARKAATPWAQYVNTHGDRMQAIQALQDEIRGDFAPRFREQYGKLTGRGLNLGAQELTNAELHVRATASPEEQAKIRAERDELVKSLRDSRRSDKGQYSSGSLIDAYAQTLQRGTAAQQMGQLGMFGGAPAPATRMLERGKMNQIAPPTRMERHSLGERAESQIASLMPHVGAGFQAGRKIDLFAGLNMDGPRVHQQRVLRMARENGGRTGAHLGTGSGKSLVSIAHATDHIERGQAAHALFAVPSKVQEQFGGEVLRYTEPGRYRFTTGSGMKHEERVAALRDAGTHMKVFTHESLRDTLLQIMADHHTGGDTERMTAKLRSGSMRERADMLRAAREAAGIKPWCGYGDEAHKFLVRDGQEPSTMAMVMQAAFHPLNATQYLSGTATPVKNDASEAWAMAAMIDPDRYGDRHEFMQSFGQNTTHNAQALQRELSHRLYASHIPPEGVERTDSENPRIVDGRKVAGDGPLELHPEHRKLVDGVQAAYERVRKAHRRGRVDVASARELAPHRFEGVPEARHEEVAREVGQHAGIIRETAMRKAINTAPPEINTKLQAMTAVIQHDLQHGHWRDRDGNMHTGKPAIVFSDSFEDVRMIHDHLRKQGLRVGMISGRQNSAESEAVRLGFNPPKGTEATIDVLVMTAAGEAGVNAQRGKTTHHYDVPMTGKSHQQRSGRAYRQGQVGDVDIHDWHTNTEYDQAARRRLRSKVALGEVFQDPGLHLDEDGVAGEYQRVLAEKRKDAAA